MLVVSGGLDPFSFPGCNHPLLDTKGSGRDGSCYSTSLTCMVACTQTLLFAVGIGDHLEPQKSMQIRQLTQRASLICTCFSVLQLHKQVFMCSCHGHVSPVPKQSQSHNRICALKKFPVYYCIASFYYINYRKGIGINNKQKTIQQGLHPSLHTEHNRKYMLKYIQKHIE